MAKKTKTLYHAVLYPNGKEYPAEVADAIMATPNNGGITDKPLNQESDATREETVTNDIREEEE